MPRDVVVEEHKRPDNLDLPAVTVTPSVPEGITLVPASPEYDRGAYEVALEAEADIPSGEPIRTGDFDAWQARDFDPLVSRELSFVALEQGRVVGYALL